MNKVHILKENQQILIAQVEHIFLNYRDIAYQTKGGKCYIQNVHTCTGVYNELDSYLWVLI